MELLIFPGSSVSKEFTCSAGDPGSIPISEDPPGEGNGNPFQYSCLGNPMDSGAWWAAVHGVAKSQTKQQILNNNKNLPLPLLKIRCCCHQQ